MRRGIPTVREIGLAERVKRVLRGDQRNAWVLNRTPAGRWGEPVELCGALLFFASNASNFITGQILYIDGGFTAGSDWRKGDYHAREG